MLRVQPDMQKASSLKTTALITLKRLKETDLFKYPTNSLTDYYDIVRKLMGALTLMEGVKFKGEGAHKELIDYVCRNYDFNESIRLFTQDLRDYRNRVSYEGFMVKEEYIKDNRQKIEEIIERLIEIINKKLN